MLRGHAENLLPFRVRSGEQASTCAFALLLHCSSPLPYCMLAGWCVSQIETSKWPEVDQASFSVSACSSPHVTAKSVCGGSRDEEEKECGICKESFSSLSCSVAPQISLSSVALFFTNKKIPLPFLLFSLLASHSFLCLSLSLSPFLADLFTLAPPDTPPDPHPDTVG